jgi:D-alanyl-lipoteichoic acid acyltransferase DltB (MBOAT superfamily)
LYIPLGGSAHGEWQTARNLLITMMLAGLWHGANWTFIVFGAMHGAVLVVERVFSSAQTQPRDAVLPDSSASFFSVWARRIFTFNLFCLTLIFFRASSLSSAMQLLAGLSNLAWRTEYASAFVMLSLFSVPLFCVDLLLEASNQEYPFANAPYAMRTALATSAVAVLALFSGNNFNAFVYFQF